MDAMAKHFPEMATKPGVYVVNYGQQQILGEKELMVNQLNLGKLH